MKTLFIFIFIALTYYFSSAQTVTNSQEMAPMSDTYQKAYKLGSVYYKTGTNTPFTGILYGKYDNGNYQTMQEYVAGVGNGKWIDYNP